jgi:predicted 3-demethylubiquinone-9 3-methyltransferase (glyoxalase superfamily)
MHKYYFAAKIYGLSANATKEKDILEALDEVKDGKKLGRTANKFGISYQMLYARYTRKTRSGERLRNSDTYGS